MYVKQHSSSEWNVGQAACEHGQAAFELRQATCELRQATFDLGRAACEHDHIGIKISVIGVTYKYDIIDIF